MVYLFTFLLLTICLLSILSSQGMLNPNQIRRHKTKPTMFDVREFIVKGEKDAAVRLYCQIFSVNRKDAQTAVDELERSIQEKNFEV